MQTKLNILASAIIGVSGLCALVSHNTPALIFFIIGILLYLAAYLSKDKKNKQIEEIHSEITNNKLSKPTERSTSIIESYMQTARRMEIDDYNSDVVALNRNLASRGVYRSGMAIMQIKELKLTHIEKFVTGCLDYVASTQSSYLLEKPSVKSLFEGYQVADITEITEIIKNQSEARGLNIRQDAIQQEIMPPIVSEINNVYNAALLRIDAM